MVNILIVIVSSHVISKKSLLKYLRSKGFYFCGEGTEYWINRIRNYCYAL